MAKAPPLSPTVAATVKDGTTTVQSQSGHAQVVPSARTALAEASASLSPSRAVAGGAGTSLARKGGSSSAEQAGSKYGLRASLDAVSIRYVLECHRDGQSYFAMPLPNQPAFKHVSKRPGVSVRYTLGEFPVREHTEARMWTLSFGGMAGSAVRWYPKALESPVYMSGVQALIQFDTFLSAYQQLAQTDGYAYLRDADKHLRLYDRTYLLLHDFDEGYVYRVEVQSFDWTRDGATRVGNAEWRLTLHAYRFEITNKSRVLYASAAGFAPSIRLGVYSSRESREFAEALKNAEQAGMVSPLAVRGLAAKVDERDMYSTFLEPTAASVLTETARKRVKAVVAPLREFQQKVDAYREVTASLVDVARIPLGVCAEIVRSGEKVLALFRDVRDAGMDYTADVSSLSRQLLRVHEDVATAVRDLAQVFGNLRGPSAMLAATLDGKEADALSLNITAKAFLQNDGPSSNLVVHVVQAGETWQDVATHYYGAPDAWTTIALWNKTKGAYDGPTGGMLLPGSFVKVPGVLGAPSAGAVASVKKPADFYGTDLAFDFKTGDLVLDAVPYVVYDGTAYVKTDPDKKDFALVTGVENFKQALLHRLLTPRGEVPFLPDYGLLPVHVGDAITDQVVAQTLATMATNLQQDPRVLKVSNATVEFDVDTLLAQFDVVGLTGGQIGVVVPLL